MNETPKSYLSDEERVALLKNIDMEGVCLAESGEATKAGDLDAAWQWLSLVKLPVACLTSIKHWYGADFITENGFDTSEADKVLGNDWLLS